MLTLMNENPTVSDLRTAAYVIALNRISGLYEAMGIYCMFLGEVRAWRINAVIHNDSTEPVIASISEHERIDASGLLVGDNVGAMGR